MKKFFLVQKFSFITKIQNFFFSDIIEIHHEEENFGQKKTSS